MAKNLTLIDQGLADVATWLNDNLLTLNIQKTNYICFAPYHNSQPAPDFAVRIHQHQNCDKSLCNCPPIQKVSCLKYLGVMIDQRMSWHSHLELIMIRVRKLIWIFKSLRYVMNQKLLNQTYVALAQSVTSYCIPIWGSASKTNMLDLERAQRSLIKVMYFKPYRFPTDRLYVISDLLSVRKLYVLNIILKYHKSLPFNQAVLNKRRKDIVAPIYNVRTAFAERQYACQAPYIYNKINRILNIYPMNINTCKFALTNWLKTLTYADVEGLLVRIT